MVTISFSELLAQQSIVLKVIDSAKNEPVAKASYVIYKAKDSVLVKFGTTNDQGTASIKNLLPGNYILRITHVEYMNFVKEWTYSQDSNSTYLVKLIDKINLLESVTVTNKFIGISFKGDTTTFNTDSFLVNKTDNIETLIKNIPGFHVNEEGFIFYNGIRIEKLMLEGEEYFSNHPAMITQTLKGELLERIQLFNSKSKFSEFTGINDGKDKKTLNLQLKESRTKILFGKAKSSIGNQKIYNNELMTNYYEVNRRIAAYSIISNNENTGLSWRDESDYSEHFLDRIEQSGNQQTQTTPLNLWDGNYNQNGLPNTKLMGMHFSQNWNQKKNKIVVNYKFNELNLFTQEKLNSNYQFNDNILLRTSSVDQNLFSSKHLYKLNYLTKINDNSDLEVNWNGSYENKNIKQESFSNLLSIDQLLNEQNRMIHSKGNIGVNNIESIYRLKIGNNKSLLWSTKYLSKKEEFVGYLNAHDSSITKNRIVEQDKNELMNNKSFSSKISYVVSIHKNRFITLSAGMITQSSTLSLKSFDLNLEKIDSLSSIEFKNNNTIPHLELGYSLKGKKLEYSFLGNIGLLNFNSTNKYLNTFTKNKFIYIDYDLTFNWKKRNSESLLLSFTGKTQAPSIQYLQNGFMNIDPMNRIIGNPLLKPDFILNYYLTYNNFKNNGAGYSITTYFQQNTNAISTTDQVNIEGERTTSFFNIGGNYNYSFFFNKTFHLLDRSLYLNLNTQYTSTKIKNRTNGDLIENMYKTGDINIEPKYMWKQNIISFRIGIKNNEFKSILANTNYLTFYINPAISLNYKNRIQLKSDFSHLVNEQNDLFGEKVSLSLWHTSVGYKFLPSRNLIFTLGGRDILNNNKNLIRLTQNNITIQRLTNTLPRYFYINLSYNFSKTKR